MAKFLRPLAEALEAGVSLDRWLDSTIARHTLPPGVHDVLLDAAAGRATVAEALGKSGLMSEPELALVDAAEKSGTLPSALKAIDNVRREVDKQRRRLAMGLAYPAFVIVGIAMIAPAPLLVDAGLAGYLTTACPVPAAVLLAGVVGFVLVPRLPPEHNVRKSIRRLALTIPLLGGALRRQAIAVFVDLLGQLVGAGLSMTESVELAMRASGHPALSGRARRVVMAIRRGNTLTEALSSIEVLPDSVLAQLSQAEMTGTIDTVLPRLAKQEAAASRRTLLVATLVTVGLFVLAAALLAGWAVVEGVLGYFEAIDSAVDGMQ